MILIAWGLRQLQVVCFVHSFRKWTWMPLVTRPQTPHALTRPKPCTCNACDAWLMMYNVHKPRANDLRSNFHHGRTWNCCRLVAHDYHLDLVGGALKAGLDKNCVSNFFSFAEVWQFWPGVGPWLAVICRNGHRRPTPFQHSRLHFIHISSAPSRLISQYFTIPWRSI